jgi:hypothetical protein
MLVGRRTRQLSVCGRGFGLGFGLRVGFLAIARISLSSEILAPMRPIVNRLRRRITFSRRPVYPKTGVA